MTHDATALVVVPTYDEAENIRAITSAITDAVPGAHVLVVDDGSPDGTGDIVRGLAEQDDRIHGVSKMSGSIVGEAMLRVTQWGLQRRFGRRRSA